jgi:hypothetical protein
MATNENVDDMNLDQPATRRDIHEIRAEMNGRFEEVHRRFEEVHRRFEEVHRHIDVLAEAFKSEFANLYDWSQLTTSTLGGRIDTMDRDHGGRLSTLEHRVTRLEAKRK